MNINITLLPAPTFQQSAELMPTKLLEQQAVLACHILLNLTGEAQQYGAPIIRLDSVLVMWRGFEFSLGCYAQVLIDELYKRSNYKGNAIDPKFITGYFDAHPEIVEAAAKQQAMTSSTQAPMPAWANNPATYEIHQNMLLNWVTS